MSDILIKGMEMPTRCYTCPCADLEFYDCNLMPGTRIEQYKRLDDCPLIPVQSHGRLIDADALMKEFEKAQRTMEQHGQEYSCSFMSSSQEISTEWYCVEDMLENAPTIIPADTPEEE